MARPPPKDRAPPLPKRAAVTDATSGPEDKGKQVEENEPVTPVAGSSGLSLEEKLAALTLAHDGGSDDDFTDDDSDTELDFEISKDSVAKLRYTAILLLPLVPQPEMASVIITVQMLLKCVLSSLLYDGANTKAHQESTRIDRALVSRSLLPRLISTSHVMPEEPVSDHDFAVRVVFRVKMQVRTGPGLWRMHPSTLGRLGARKITEEVERSVTEKGGGFEALISRLNTSLRAYAKEESKRIRATVNHLALSVAELKQAAMGNPKDQLLREKLQKCERQLKEYHACRRERAHHMAGMANELVEEVPSPHLSARIKILEAASSYYWDLFGEDKRTAVSSWVPAVGRRLWFLDAECLQVDWTEEEVKRALKEMACNKTPGKDGIPKELFEQNWDVLGKHLMALVKEFIVTAKLPTSVKDAVTILLHKKGAKEQLENYHPITMLNFSYKVLAQVMASRIKRILHKVISPEQFGFIHGRRVSDAVGLVANIIDAAKNGKEDWYMLLVDFRKAFDSVSWDFIFDILREMGFSERFVGWVKGLHENTRTSLLINGWLGEAVDVVSGVRQRCPLAPYLFLCAVEPLARVVEKRKVGITLSSCAGQRLGYVGYADDTTLLLQGKQQIIRAEEILEEFKCISGLETNTAKSVVMPIGANLGKRSWRTDSFLWAEADEVEKLLGIWVMPSGSCQPTWDKALERIVGKLSLWQPQYLPIKARRAQGAAVHTGDGRRGGGKRPGGDAYLFHGQKDWDDSDGD
ncbi:unnamed protein product [Closterium sp. Yama58-4]|nr:unnamed protein product [Closterium sp. Yama58-4]